MSKKTGVIFSFQSSSEFKLIYTSIELVYYTFQSSSEFKLFSFAMGIALSVGVFQSSSEFKIVNKAIAKYLIKQAFNPLLSLSCWRTT